MEQQLQIAKGVVARKNQDGTFIVMKMDESSLFYRVEGIASEIWSSLSDKKTPEQILTEMQGKYPTHSDELKKDIPLFISELQSKKLISNFGS